MMMKNISKEWWIKMAELEGNLEVGAGLPDIKKIMKSSFPDLDLPEVQARIRKSKLEDYARIEPFQMQNWPAELWNLTFGPNILIPIPVKDILQVQDGMVSKKFEEFVKYVDAIFDGKRWFVKTSNRSPKDWSYPYLPIYDTGVDVSEAITCSMRTFDDMCNIYDIDKPFFMVLRRPIDIPKSAEFRCFVKNGELIGITQYFYDEKFDNLPQIKQEVQDSICNFFVKVQEAFKQENFVFDVFVDLNNIPDCTLIEVNPYGMSDPCLFENYANIEKSSRLEFRIVV